MECGTCVCYNPEQFEGPYCEYDKTHCQRYGGFLCNGTVFELSDNNKCLISTIYLLLECFKCNYENLLCLSVDRGSCIMGKCTCAEGWTGNACECPKSNQTCLDSKGVSRSRIDCLGSDGVWTVLLDILLLCSLCLHRVSAMGEVNVYVDVVYVQTLVLR